MISPSELRKGNKVYSILNTTAGILKKEITISCIHKNTIECVESGTWSYSSIEPIPISKAILPLLGFVNKKHKWNDGTISEDLFWFGKYFIHIYSNDNFEINNDFNLFALYNGDIQVLLRSELKGVHDLQNIIYSLARKEL